MARIDRMENMIEADPSSPTGERIVGFRSYYQDGPCLFSQAIFGQRSIRFYSSETAYHEVTYDRCVEDLDMYHTQYGISLAESEQCFFICSWLKGVYCLDLQTGLMKWHFPLKHATALVPFDTYAVCAFQEIGLRKIGYNGFELDRYQIATYDVFDFLDGRYVFIGPRRGFYSIIDTADMQVAHTIKRTCMAKPDEELILLSVSGSPHDLLVSGYKNGQPFSQRISSPKK